MFQNDCKIFSMLFSKQKAIQQVTIAFSRLIYVTFSRVNDRSYGHDVLFDYNNCGVILNGRSSIHTQTPSHIFYTMISDIAGQCLAAKRKVYTFKNEWECYKILNLTYIGLGIGQRRYYLEPGTFQYRSVYRRKRIVMLYLIVIFDRNNFSPALVVFRT